MLCFDCGVGVCYAGNWSCREQRDMPTEIVDLGEDSPSLLPSHRRAGQGRRDKAELRALVQEAVHEYSFLKNRTVRNQLLRTRPNISDEELEAAAAERQPVIEEYDPVVEMALVSVDHTQPTQLRMYAASQAAQYMRPKLKSVEVLADPDQIEADRKKADLAAQLVGLLNIAAQAKRDDGPAIDPRAGAASPDDGGGGGDASGAAGADRQEAGVAGNS